MARKQMNVRIKGDLRDEFKKVCKEKGLSTCFVLETLLQGWLAGVGAAYLRKVDASEPIVIKQQIDYNVSRARRMPSKRDLVGSRVKDFKTDQWFDVDANGVVHRCNCYDPKIGWFYNPDEAER